MKADEEDLNLNREFQSAMDKGPPQPSWDDVEARAGGFSLRWQRRRQKVVLVYAFVLLAVAIPALAFAAKNVFFDSSPPAFQSAIDAFARIGGPPGTPADTPAVTAEARRVLTVPLSDGKTAALWAAPAIDHNYCFDTQVVSDDADYLRAVNPSSDLVSPGQGLDWGAGYMGNVGCGEHARALDLGFDVQTRSGKPPLVLISGGSGLRDADSVEVTYEDGSSGSFPAAYVDSPVDTVLFMFQIPLDHTKLGSRPTELILRDESNNVLARDDEFFPYLWQQYDASIAAQATISSNPDGLPICDPDMHKLPGHEPLPGEGCVEPSDGMTMSRRPNSPGYQWRETEYPGAASGIS